MRIFKCYSAGPDLFPRDLPNGNCETWDEAYQRACKSNRTISDIPEFEVITPTDADLDAWPKPARPRACLIKDLLCASQSDIVFANVTPFGGREPDSGTVVEATTCALSGGLLVLWADPLTTFAERYADADVHPESDLDEHYNLMLEQIYRWNWELHFDTSLPVFDSLSAAVQTTAEYIRAHGLHRKNLLSKLDQATANSENMPTAIKEILNASNLL